MSLQAHSVLFVSLNGDPASQVIEKLNRADIGVTAVGSLNEAEERLLSRDYKVCVLRTAGICDAPLKLISFCRQHTIGTKHIVSVSSGSVEDAVRIVKAGAHDFLIGTSSDPRVIESILREATNYRESPKEYASAAPSAGELSAVLVGQSPAMCEIRSAVNLVAKSQSTVLVTGESGTGKEVVARLIHQQSPRSEKAFIAINCAALPKDVIENELFGHEKGAFTGALAKKSGCFELANFGTLLFDEIAEMGMDTQAKLLRAIETQKFRRLGGSEEVSVDVRMIAATNKNITTALKSKELREDLYYRLSVVEIFIPPLRERKEDISLLIEYFSAIFSARYGRVQPRFSAETMEILSSYEWPGNVREVRNVVERALVICTNDTVTPQYLPARIRTKVTPDGVISIPVGCSTQEAERILILQTLASAGYNKAKAAKILGVSRKTLHNKLNSFQQTA
jgi:DNA-binding NtrC family response regulator